MKAIFQISLKNFVQFTCGLTLAFTCSDVRAQKAVLTKDGVVIQEWEITPTRPVSPARGATGDPATPPKFLTPEASVIEAAAVTERSLAKWLASPDGEDGQAVLSAALESHQALLSYQAAMFKDLQKKGIPAEILKRQQKLVNRIKEAVALEKTLVDALRAERAPEQSVVDRLRELTLLPAPLPSPGPRTRVDKQEAPVLTRSQADKRLEVARAKSGAAKKNAKIFRNDLQFRAETPEIQLTPAIRAKAAELGNDPLALANFVRNEIAFQPYLGSRKGAAYTLDQGAGNDTDQASLLIALMRAAGIPSLYGKATCEVSAEAAASWLGVDSPAAAAGLLTTAGLDGVAINAPGGGVSRVSFTHTWVEAYLPFSNYRGRGSADSGRAWVRFSPSFTGSTITPGLATIDAVNPDPDAFLLDFASTTRTQLPLDNLASQLEASASAGESAIERIHEISPINLPLLPSSLPMDVLGTVAHKSSLVDQDRYKVRLSLTLGGSVLDYTSNLSDLAGANVRIDWSAATAADQTTIDGFGGLYSTPPNLVQLRPSLIVGGVAVAGPGTAVGMGRSLNFTMSFLAPAGASNIQPNVSNTIDAGNNQAISFDTFLDQHPGLESDSPGQGDLFDTFLHQTAHEYLQRVNDGLLRGERLLRVRSTQGVSEAIVGNQVAVGFNFGTPVSFKWDGLFVDADRRIVGPFSVDNDDAKSRRFMVITGMEGSNLEDRVFSDGYQQAAVSTIRILQLASEANIPICTITSSIAAQCPGFSHPASVRSAVNSALAGGNIVIIPRDPMTIGQWRGTGYVDMEPSGAAGWIISGGINGSVRTPAGGATVERWPITEPCDATSVTGVILDPPADAPAPDAIFCADDTRLRFEASLTFTCEDGSVITQPKSLPFRNTTKRLGGGNYTINLIAFGVPPQIIRRFTIVELKSLKVIEVAKPANFISTTSMDKITISETPGEDTVKIEIEAEAKPGLPENAAYLLWKIEGDTANPETSDFGTNPFPVELDISTDNRTFIVKAGCDDNQDNVLDDGEVTHTIEVLVSCAELDIDANGDGAITDDDDDPAETAKGGIVCANVDDDNDDDIKDMDQDSVTGEDDLEPINVGFSSMSPPDSGTLKLEATSGGGRIKLWSSATKGTEVTLPKTWTVGTDTIPPTLYVEGISGSTAARDVKLKLTFEDGTTMCEDEIALTVVEITVHNFHEMADIDAAMVQDTEFVGLQTRLRADIKPASASNDIQWTIGGSRIKTFEHDIDNPAEHKTVMLDAADLEESEVSFFWTATGMNHDVKLEVMPAGFSKTCLLDLEFLVENDPDPSSTFYCNRDDVHSDERASPNGETDIYRVLDSHHAWHAGGNMANGEGAAGSAPSWGDVPGFGAGYNGTAFLRWHRFFLESHASWRSTFGLAAVSGSAPGALPTPEYLKAMPPGNSLEESRYYGYVRLGEFQDVDQLGRDVVSPWHNSGHGVLARATGDRIMGGFSSPATIDNTFWRWHGDIESVHAAWRRLTIPDRAAVSTTIPAAGPAVAGPLTEVIITFSKPISSEVHLDAAQLGRNPGALRASALTVNGQPATRLRDMSPSTTRFRVFRFTGFPDATGSVNIVLSGTTSHAASSWTVTVNP